MLATDLSHPIRTCAVAGPFSERWFGTANGRSLKPSPNSSAFEYTAFASNVDPIGGKTVRCSQAVGFPSGPSAAFIYIAETEWYVSNLMSSSRLQTTFIGFTVFLGSNASWTGT